MNLNLIKAEEKFSLSLELNKQEFATLFALVSEHRYKMPPSKVDMLGHIISEKLEQAIEQLKVVKVKQ